MIEGFGPVSAAAVALVVALVEMVTVSDTGFIGFFMNVLSTCAFVLPAAWMYKRRHTLKGAAAAVGRPQIYESMEWVYTKRAGLYTAAAAAGDKVRRGQMIGFVADCFGTPVEKIISPIMNSAP